MSTETHEQRREAQRDLARRAILDATEALLLDDGFDAFSIRRLVERCGYAAPSIYHYFGDKDGLFDALIEERFAKLTAQLKRVPRGEDPVLYIRGLAMAFVRFGLKSPTHFRLLFTPRAGDETPPPSGEDARQLLEVALNALWETGRLRFGDPRTAGQALSVLCQGLVWSRIARPDHDWSKTLNEDSIDALLRGLVAPDDAAASGAGEKV
ncbi:MAG TPA: TetR/AcrR family transcriptional regulator [Myxococcota bacterium]|jgi:AcrR family transcriptional regulator